MSANERPVIRARQRSRTSLRPFSLPLDPRITEIGIDRIQIAVSGTWALDPGSANRNDISSRSYRDRLKVVDTRRAWFCKPSTGYGETIVIKTEKRAQTTLGFMRATVDGWDTGGGRYGVKITCNPTRTLAHHLTFAHEYPNFAESLRELSPFAFFDGRGVLQSSLDAKDNWIADLDLARRLLGPDIFQAFFPIFVEQLQKLVVAVVAPFDGLHVEAEGTDHTFRHRGLRGRLEWGRANVPQIETYFERHHSKAADVVRRVGQRILTSLDEARVRHHLNRISFERRVDRFSVRTELPAERDLSIYAKAHDRLRFEVSRPKRGRYFTAFLSEPADRLRQIFDSERRDVLECCDWDGVAAFFAEPDEPFVGDLVELVGAIAAACISENIDPRPIYAGLFSSGGLHSDTVPEATPELLRRLVQAGIIERASIRRRDTGSPRRYSLAGRHRVTFDAVQLALAGAKGAEAIL